MSRQSRRTEQEQGHHQESDWQRGRRITLPVLVPAGTYSVAVAAQGFQKERIST